ncbi:glycosyltransferase family 2 protein [Bacillus rhizoplanae]|uniref:glycosyltransferase family 2 protein n=1 Tax=Bacillus rhizoplanae TaxID=2880966 RepID=UPI003D1A09FC
MRVSVVILTHNEAQTISGVLEEVKKVQPYEIIVVANGCTDDSEQIAKELGCIVISSEEVLGNDVGRVVGAKCAKGEVLLFLDGDFPIPSSSLHFFLNPILHGQADVILNNFDALFKKKQRPHSITVWRQILNEIVDQADLQIDSILSVPHAITKEAVESIGYDALCNPIVAHVRLTAQGWRIQRHCLIDVITSNKFCPAEHEAYGNKLAHAEQRMIGDHIEALGEWLDNYDRRGAYTDGNRRRDIVLDLRELGDQALPPYYNGWGVQSNLYSGKQLSIIIPAQNEEMTIALVIQEARKIEPLEIIVVVNGSNDKTATIAKQCGAATIVYEETLGNDVGRSIGAQMAKGDILLFIDGDFVIPAKDLYPFAKAIAEGQDVVLNDLNNYLDLRAPLHLVTALKYALNLACNRKDLGVGSLVAVPNAFSKVCLEQIGFDSLLSPCVAQVKAILAGFLTSCVHRVEVDQMNRIRPNEHFAVKEHAPAVLRIIGDHEEGMSCLIEELGIRGGFHDGGRKREIK